MSSYREATAHARSGGTARRGEKEIRFLTSEEAEPILLDICPERRVAHDDDPKSKTFGKALEKDGELVIETIAPPNYPTKRLGLYDVGQHPPVGFGPTEEDIHMPVELDEEGKEKLRVLRTDWELQ